MGVDTSKELAHFLEKLRFQRNISQEEFTSGIISNRQYQRYIRGDSPMPFHLINAFAERLGIKKDVLLLEFQNSTVKESYQIVSFLNHITGFEFEKAAEVKKHINPNYIIDKDNLKMYNYSCLLHKYYQKNMSKDELKNDLISLIDYPYLLNRQSISMMELLVLSQLIDFVDETEKDNITLVIQSFFKNPDLVWTGSQILTYHIIIFRLAKFFGTRNDYHQVIFYSNYGIKLNHQAKSIINQHYYHYFLALSYYRLNNINSFEKHLFKCLNLLLINFDDSKNKLLLDIIQKDFNIDYKDFMIEYIKKSLS